MTKKDQPERRPRLEPGGYTDSMEGWHARSPDGQWWVHGDWVNARDARTGAEVSGHFRTLTIEPWDGRRRDLAVTSSVMRQLPVGRWLNAARSESIESLRFMLDGLPTESIGAARGRESIENLRRQPDRPGRRGYPPEHWVQVALRYLELDRRGVRAISSQLAEEHAVPVQTAKDWVSQARRRGYLTPARAGRAGGDPGPTLRTYLEQRNREAD